MKTNQLDHLISISKPVELEDEYNTEQGYEHVCDVWAGRDSRRGTIDNSLGDGFTAYTDVFRVWISTEVHEGWRVKDGDSGFIYDVVSIDCNRAKRLRTLTCVRVNE